ncbi:MAG TPA: hypothetical protein ENI27_06195 [bacterium]|nr:hypothetical protein [bacterium]
MLKRLFCKIGLVILMLLPGFSFLIADTGTNINFQEIFPKHYASAMTYLQGVEEEISSIVAYRGGDVKVLLPVVFPELIRYFLVQDIIEITGLKIFYVHLGDTERKFANFSIGRFQMKPRFVEELEQSVRELGLTAEFDDIISYPEGSDGKDIRRIRISRLADSDWQALYLACFGVIVDHLFGQISWGTTEEKIAFYATAYNHGFNEGEEEIKKWIDVKLFPHGIEYGRPQYSYAEVATFFYHTYWEQALEESTAK